MLSAKEIEAYLGRDGWPFERVDHNTWRSGFRGNNACFRFYIRLSDHWVFFTIVPFLVAPKSPEAEQGLCRRLLELNRDMNMAKFALDDDQDVVLTVELPVENLVFSEFKDALDALSYYADKHYVELLNIAHGEIVEPGNELTN